MSGKTNTLGNQNNPTEGILSAELHSIDSPAICKQIDDLTSQLAIVPEDRSAVADMLITDIDYGFGAYADDPQALGHIFDSLDKFEAIAETSFLDEYVFHTLDGNALPAVQQLFLEGHPAVQSVLTRFTKGLFERRGYHYGAEIAKLVSIVEPVLGSPSSWKEHGRPKPGVPDFLVDFTKEPQFAGLCIDYQVWKISQEQDPEQKFRQARQIEEDIVGNVLGIRDDLSADFRYAIDARTMKRDRGDLPSASEIDVTKWGQVLTDFAKSIEAVGLDNTSKLYQDFGIVNFDRYSPEQLKTMVRLIEGDAELIEALRQNAFTVMLSDALATTAILTTRNVNIFMMRTRYSLRLGRQDQLLSIAPW